MKINFVFLRHGESCQQVAYNKKRGKEYNEFFRKFADPTLSDKGKIDSINAGKSIKEFLSKGDFIYDVRQYDYEKPIDLKINDFDIIGSSPMLRAIETAYFMSNGNYGNDGNDGNDSKQEIFPFPYLRECYYCDSRDNLKLLDSQWPLKSIKDQEEYLKSVNIDNINFKYVKNVENGLRLESGDIKKFIEWFGKNVELPDKPDKPDKESINVLIVIHSHVLRKVGSGGHFDNNMGFIITSTYQKDNKEIIYNEENLIAVWPTIKGAKFECPTVRCPDIC